METSEFFRLSEERSTEIIEEVKAAVRSWKEVAIKYGISRREQEIKALAFRNSED